MPMYMDPRAMQQSVDAARAAEKAAKQEADIKKARDAYENSLVQLRAGRTEETAAAAELAHANLMRVSPEDRNNWYGKGQVTTATSADYVNAETKKEQQFRDLSFGERMTAALQAFAAQTTGNISTNKWEEAWSGKVEVKETADPAVQTAAVTKASTPATSEAGAQKVDAEAQARYDSLVGLAKEGKSVAQGHSESQEGQAAAEAFSVQRALIASGAININTPSYKFKDGVKTDEKGAVYIASEDLGYASKDGGLTAEAIKVHQKKHGLKETGVADAATIASLAVYENPANKGLAADVIAKKAQDVAHAVSDGKTVEEAVKLASAEVKPAEIPAVSTEAKTAAVNNVSPEALAAASKLGGNLTNNGSTVKGEYNGSEVAYTSGTAIPASKELELL